MYCFLNTLLIYFFQFSSVAQSCPTLCDPMDCSMPGFPVHHKLPSLLKLMSIESVIPSSHLILCRPLLLLPSTFPSIKVFSNKSVLLIRWLIFTSAPKYWSFSFNIRPSVRPGTDFQGALKSFPTPQFKSISSSAQFSLWSNSHVW